MYIDLYYMSTENNRMDKTNYLSLIAHLNGTFRESVSIINPVFTVKYDNTFIDFNRQVLQCNYVYIELFRRYYFVTNIIAVTTDLWEIHCVVDVLMSFKTELGELDVFCERNEYNYNDLLIDDKVPSNNVEIIETIESDGGFPLFENDTNKKFIVSTAGYKSGVGYDENDYINKISVPYIHYYIMDITALFAFQKELFLGSSSISTFFVSWLVNPSDCLRSITIYPFALTRFEILAELVNKVVCSDRQIELKDENNNPIDVYDITTRVVPIIGLSLNIPHYYNNFLDYEPYTKIQLNVPFLGVIDLPTDVCMGKRIDVEYSVDLESGDCSVNISAVNPQDTSEKIVVYVGCCQIGYSIPIIKTNLSEQVKGITSSLIGIVGGAVTGGTAGGAMLANGAAQLAENQSRITSTKNATSEQLVAYAQRNQAIRSNVAGGIINEATNYISKNTVGIISGLKGSVSSGNTGGNVLTSNRLNRYLTAIIKRPNAYYPTGYNHLVGKPSKFTGKLKDLKGYTELSGFHIEGIPNCTLEEQSEINTILRSGFLMPEPTP